MARIKHGFHRLLQEGSIFVIEGEDEADNRKIQYFRKWNSINSNILYNFKYYLLSYIKYGKI